jgi:hypothetical protein
MTMLLIAGTRRGVAFADRRGLSGEIRVADAPERKGVELLGRARHHAPDGRRSTHARDRRGRGAGEAKAAAERQPRRGMFDGLKLSAEPAKAAEPAPARGRREEKAAPSAACSTG